MPKEVLLEEVLLEKQAPEAGHVRGLAEVGAIDCVIVIDAAPFNVSAIVFCLHERHVLAHAAGEGTTQLRIDGIAKEADGAIGEQRPQPVAITLCELNGLGRWAVVIGGAGARLLKRPQEGARRPRGEGV